MDKHLSGKLMLISDCKTPNIKFDGMYDNTQILIDVDAAHFLLWMTFGSLEKFDFDIRSSDAIVVMQTFSNDAAFYYWWIWCCYVVTLSQFNAN